MHETSPRSFQFARFVSCCTFSKRCTLLITAMATSVQFAPIQDVICNPAIKLVRDGLMSMMSASAQALEGQLTKMEVHPTGVPTLSSRIARRTEQRQVRGLCVLLLLTCSYCTGTAGPYQGGCNWRWRHRYVDHTCTHAYIDTHTRTQARAHLTENIRLLCVYVQAQHHRPTHTPPTSTRCLHCILSCT